MSSLPPSRSPKRPQQEMYRDRDMTEADSDDDGTAEVVMNLFNSMRLGRMDADEVDAAFRKLSVAGDTEFAHDITQAFARCRVRKGQDATTHRDASNGSPSGGSAKENEHEERQKRPSETSTPFETAAPSPLNDSTPTTTNATPGRAARKGLTRSASERFSSPRGRSASRSGSATPTRSTSRTCTGTIRSRSRTPVRDFLRQRTPDRVRAEQAPPTRPRSQSPFRKLFSPVSTAKAETMTGTTATQDVPPPPPPSAERRGSIPNTAAAASRSGLPRTPIRSTQPTVEATPAAQTHASMPSPPSTAGNTFCSSTSGNQSPIPWDEATPSASHDETMDDKDDPCKTGYGKMRKKGPSPPNLSDMTGNNNTHFASAPNLATNLNGSTQFSMPAGEVPKFNLGTKTKSERAMKAKSRRTTAFKRASSVRAGGPETSSSPPAAGPAQYPFVVSGWPQFQPAPGIQRTFSADPVMDRNAPNVGSPPVVGPTAPAQQPKPANNSPDSMEISDDAAETPNVQAPSVPNVQLPVQLSPDMPHFSLGTGGEKKTPARQRRNPRVAPAQRLHPKQKSASNMFPRTSPSKAKITANRRAFRSDIYPNPSGESMDSSGGQTLLTASTGSSEVDFSGRKARVSALREEARNFYADTDYYNAALKYTETLKVHAEDPQVAAAQEADDLRAVLLANRAAALLMLGCYDAVVVDCQQALPFVSEKSPTEKLAADRGPMLKAKLLSRMGKALLRLGKLHEAEQSFTNAINVANVELQAGAKQQHEFGGPWEKNKRYLLQLIADSESGKIEVDRCREAQEELRNVCSTSTHSLSPSSSSRRSNMQALIYVNKALEFAPGSASLHEKKVAILAALKRWRELAGHCERLAASAVKYDGLFDGDLAARNPFPGVALAKTLSANFFDCTDFAESSTAKLGVSAAGEAALRLPFGLLPYYLRSLRLEERNKQAMAATQSLAKLVQTAQGTSAYDSLRLKFSWLSREQDKLTRTTATKDRGDTLFREGEYLLAAAQYTSCLTIDAEGIPDNDSGEVSNAGGRLHAILHCNRAACLMAVKKFHEAVTDCTSALRIHAHYMKAILRRGRCYSRLERFEEAIGEYERWLGLVDKAKKNPRELETSNMPCLFDSPKDVSKEDIDKVKQELKEVKRSMLKAANAARAEASHREDRQRWYEQTFGAAGTGKANAQQRRQEWYSQQSSGGSRRWDSFSGRSPRRPSKNSESQREQQQRQSRYQRSSSYRQPSSSTTTESSDHYSVLQVTRDATPSQIKKAYRRMALKYHPDKNNEPEAVDKFRKVKMAYEILNDGAARSKYDAETRWNRRF